jgi:hypothetical protein
MVCLPSPLLAPVIHTVLAIEEPPDLFSCNRLMIDCLARGIGERSAPIAIISSGVYARNALCAAKLPRVFPPVSGSEQGKRPPSLPTAKDKVLCR